MYFYIFFRAALNKNANEDNKENISSVELKLKISDEESDDTEAENEEDRKVRDARL